MDRFRSRLSWTSRSGTPADDGPLPQAARFGIAGRQTVRAARRIPHHRPAGAPAEERGAEKLVADTDRVDVRAGDVDVGGGGAGGAQALQEDAYGELGGRPDHVELGECARVGLPSGEGAPEGDLR